MTARRLLWTTTLICVACSGKATVDGPGGSGGSSSSSSSSGSSTSSSTSGSSSSSSSGTTGCAGGCSVHEYCDYPDNHCGASEPGVCAPRPGGCPDQWLPTCGCDGNVYGNPCEAASSGVDVSNDEICPPPLDTFACGSTFCGYGTDYCVVQISDVGGWPDEFFCAPLPPQCLTDPPSCACLSGEPCGGQCQQDPDGSLTVICPGG